MTEAMPFLQKYDITFLRPPPICPRGFFSSVARFARPPLGGLILGFGPPNATKPLSFCCVRFFRVENKLFQGVSLLCTKQGHTLSCFCCVVNYGDSNMSLFRWIRLYIKRWDLTVVSGLIVCTKNFSVSCNSLNYLKLVLFFLLGGSYT